MVVDCQDLTSTVEMLRNCHTDGQPFTNLPFTALEMALTRDFRSTILERTQNDARFREALFTEAINAYFSGDTATGKGILRDLVNATIGFEGLAAEKNAREAACDSQGRVNAGMYEIQTASRKDGLPMLAKLSSRNQLTLPKSVINAVGAAEYFEVQAKGG